jgi:hypothetical protein
MQLAPIGVTGPADRRLVAGLREIAPVLDRLDGAVLVIGGLMVRLWLHAVPIDMPVRPTADIDLGVDRQQLRLAGDRQIVGPLLERFGFEGGYAGEPFRYSKAVDGVGDVLVDVVVPPGSSREDPPLIEKGLESVAAPGLAYAIRRGPTDVNGSFVDGRSQFSFRMPLPTLDSALVLKAALAESGLRTRLDRIRSDSVDSVTLAAACLKTPAAIMALRQQQSTRRDLRKSLRWLYDAFRSPQAIGSRRVEDHFVEEGLGPGAGTWAHEVALALRAALDTDHR